MRYKLLLIEDEPGLCLTLTDRLQKEGYAVDVCSDGEGGFNQAASQGYDLIILDLMLPNKNGYDICRDLRQMGLAIPILMLTARHQTMDKVLGLKIGADDYLTKPFEMPELLARIEALLRRTTRTFAPAAASYRFGTVQVDFRKTEVTRGSSPVRWLNPGRLQNHILRQHSRSIGPGNHYGHIICGTQLLERLYGCNRLCSPLIVMHPEGTTQLARAARRQFRRFNGDGLTRRRGGPSMGTIR
jgi:DNA-binding response OmpR family regulator